MTHYVDFHLKDYPYQIALNFNFIEIRVLIRKYRGGVEILEKQNFIYTTQLHSNDISTVHIFIITLILIFRYC